jgi:hypothetical protein
MLLQIVTSVEMALNTHATLIKHAVKALLGSFVTILLKVFVALIRLPVARVLSSVIWLIINVSPSLLSWYS